MADSSYDVIVIGGGPNGLVTAAHLAKAGRKVGLFERRDELGGLAIGDEFHSGHQGAGVLTDTSGIRHELIRDLNLNSHGLELESEPPAAFTPRQDGAGLMLYGSTERAVQEIATLSQRDAERYKAYQAFIARVRGPILDLLFDQPPDLVGDMSRREMLGMGLKAMKLRRLGERDMTELVRVAAMSVADWLDDWFETDLLKASLAAVAIQGAFVGPRSPGSAINLLLWECRKGPTVKGGAPAFVAALEKAARANGVDIHTGSNIERINVGKDGAFASVMLEDGGEVDARILASSADPRTTLLSLVPRGLLGQKIEDRLLHFRCNGTAAKVDIALSSSLQLAGQGSAERVRTGECLDDLEKSFDAIKYRRYSESPILDIYLQGGSAPEGCTTLSMLAHYVPYLLEGDWTYRDREQLGERVVNVLTRYAPALRDAVVVTSVLTPVEIENRYGNTYGHILHGEQSIDQLLVRPIPEAARYATPIKGLFLCGSGSHPGGGITAAPGALAAQTILKNS